MGNVWLPIGRRARATRNPSEEWDHESDESPRIQNKKMPGQELRIEPSTTGGINLRRKIGLVLTTLC